jgi:hypothetical protein
MPRPVGVWGISLSLVIPGKTCGYLGVREQSVNMPGDWKPGLSSKSSDIKQRVLRVLHRADSIAPAESDRLEVLRRPLAALRELPHHL